MTKFYIKYIPVRRGLTGLEYLEAFIDEHFPTVKFKGVINDGIAHYGILEGEGDDLSKAIWTIEGRFSVSKLDEDSFIGICHTLYIPQVDEITQEIFTFENFMNSHGIIVTQEDILKSVKQMKRTFYKEIAKKKFAPDNDSIADLAKSMLLMTSYYDELTPEEKTIVDNKIVELKQIYNKAMCIDALSGMVGNLQSVLGEYYNAIVSLENAQTVDDAKNVKF